MAIPRLPDSMNAYNNSDMAHLKAWVEGPESGAQNRSESTVLINMTHSNLQRKFLELRFDSHSSISTVKHRLHTHCGTAVDMMMLYLMDDAGNMVASLEDESAKLGFYSPKDGWTIHVIDLDPFSNSANGGLDDASKVKKYEISEESYAKRDVTFRKFKADQLKKDPNWTIKREMENRARKKQGLEPLPPPEVIDPDFQKDLADKISVGQRCQCDPGDRRGTIRFVGRAEALQPGYWVGVEYDEPMGKNNGTVKGLKYFECMDKYGGMLRPQRVEVGDYPPIDDITLTDDEDM